MPGKTLYPNRPVANCVELASVFEHSLLEDPIPANAPPSVRRRRNRMVAVWPSERPITSPYCGRSRCQPIPAPGS